MTTRDSGAAAEGESERRFRIMADTAPVMIWMCDPAGACDWFNRPWLEFTGRSMQQEVGDGWAEGVHPEDVADCMETFRSAVAARREFRMEYRLRRHDGAWRWVLDTGAPRSEPDGAFAGFIGSCVDITDRREAEEARLRAERERAEAETERARLAHQLHEADQRQKRMMREMIAGMTTGRLLVCDTPDDLPSLVADFGGAPVALTKTTLGRMRRRVREAGEAAELPKDRLQDLLTAAGEAAMNAVVHGGGGEGSVHQEHKVQVRVQDHGPGIDEAILHRATLERGFSTRAAGFGHGFWLMVRTADRVFLLTGPGGTTLLLEKEREASGLPLPPELTA